MADSSNDRSFVDARDALLAAVGKAAEDLQLFHDTVENAELAPDSVRGTLSEIQRVIDDLTRLEKGLEKVLIALGLPPATRG
jgi:hypothetical protein